jgi:2,4-dienoyl-CoA reductase-like NADH-dependent reductase (Old Yellow Enzyme family)
MLSRIAAFIESQGSVPAIQLAHAGRKASQFRPWEGGGPLGPEDNPWETVAPSSIPFDERSPAPKELSIPEIHALIESFARAARRSRECGFRIVEIHAAHGYLLNEFLSSSSNVRTDHYGGSFENRIRLLGEVVDAVREEWPDRYPLFVRVSATDWSAGGWDVASTIDLVRALAGRGVDVIDVSSGGNVAGVTVPDHDDYQVTLAGEVRAATGVPTVAVGRVSMPEMAERVLANEWADIVALGRELLRSPYWPMTAARALGADIAWPDQYLRARLD